MKLWRSWKFQVSRVADRYSPFPCALGDSGSRWRRFVDQRSFHPWTPGARRSRVRPAPSCLPRLASSAIWHKNVKILGFIVRGNYKYHIDTPLSRLHLAEWGFEPRTSWLKVVRSTAELYPLPCNKAVKIFCLKFNLYDVEITYD